MSRKTLPHQELLDSVQSSVHLACCSDNLSVALTFSKPLAETVMMVCLLVYDSVLEVNQHRQIIDDFAT